MEARKEVDSTESLSVCKQQAYSLCVDKESNDLALHSTDRKQCSGALVRTIAHRQFTFRCDVVVTYPLLTQPLPDTPASMRSPCMHSRPKILPSRPILAYSRITSPLTSVTAAAKTLPCSRSLQCRNSGANDVAALKRRTRRAEAGTSRSINPWTMSDVGSPPSRSCVVTKEGNVDTRNLGRTERVGLDTEIRCGSTVEAQWKHATRAMDGKRDRYRFFTLVHWQLSGCKTDARRTRGVGERLEKEHAR
jgi:hypothetical protein